jgi:hypothetical protein
VNPKKSFVIRIDNDTYKALEKWASDEFRSVNGQIEFLLDKALKDSGRKKSTDAGAKKSSGK